MYEAWQPAKGHAARPSVCCKCVLMQRELQEKKKKKKRERHVIGDSKAEQGVGAERRGEHGRVRRGREGGSTTTTTTGAPACVPTRENEDGVAEKIKADHTGRNDKRKRKVDVRRNASLWLLAARWLMFPGPAAGSLRLTMRAQSVAARRGAVPT